VTRSRIAAALLLGGAVLFAPALAPYDPGRQFNGFPYAPPMRPHVVDDRGWHLPFAYAARAVDPLEHRYAEDRSRRASLGGEGAPWFLLGTDALGRDILSRLLAGARLSLGVALLATALALLIGSVFGAVAGYASGWTDRVLMRVADFVLVLPTIYLVLALRGALPPVLTDPQVFAALVIVFAAVGWPSAARGVRGIVVVERQAEYAEAARAVGASPLRIIARHLLPATRGFLVVQATLLVPAFVVAEATLSFIGLGFAPPAPSWGAMLAESANARVAAETPWLLAPAAAIVLTVLVVHLASGGADPVLGSRDRSK
jgi:peptide/nickel transport system permease protein